MFSKFKLGACKQMLHESSEATKYSENIQHFSFFLFYLLVNDTSIILETNVFFIVN